MGPVNEAPRSIDDIAENLNRKLGLTVRWERDGSVVTDHTPEHRTRLSAALTEAKHDLAGMTREALELESLMIRNTTGMKISFPSLSNYLEYGFRTGGVERDFILDDSVKVALNDGLIDHWRIAADQVINDKYSEHVDWRTFLSQPDKRRTLWQTASYLEEGVKGAWTFARMKGITARELTNKEYFPSRWFTHTTDGDTAEVIAKVGYVDTDDINLSASKVVLQHTIRPRYNMTFLFDAHDLVEAVPLVHGNYSLEGEIITHVPIPAGLARAVVPTSILESQGGGSRGSEGWMSTDLVPSKIQ